MRLSSPLTIGTNLWPLDAVTIVNIYHWWPELSRENRKLLHSQCSVHIFSMLEGLRFLTRASIWVQLLIYRRTFYLNHLAGCETSSSGEDKEKSASSSRVWKRRIIKGSNKIYSHSILFEVFSRVVIHSSAGEGILED